MNTRVGGAECSQRDSQQRPKEKGHVQAAPDLQWLNVQSFDLTRVQSVCVQQKRSLELLTVVFSGASDMQDRPLAGRRAAAPSTAPGPPRGHEGKPPPTPCGVALRASFDLQCFPLAAGALGETPAGAARSTRNRLSQGRRTFVATRRPLRVKTGRTSGGPQLVLPGKDDAPPAPVHPPPHERGASVP